SQPQTLGEGANQSATGSAADKAGNTAVATVSGINVDKAAPTITGAPDRAANGAGWYNADVTVTFTCADALSGVASCTQPQSLGEGANQSATGSAADKAGNTASATVSGINVDKAAPMTTISAPTTWQNQDVPVTLSATDNLSGVTATYYTVDGGAQQSGTSFTLSAEGAHAITYWSVDAAGNAEAAHTASVQIDKTAPTITGSADRAANGAGWYNADVTVTFTCADALSGVASCSPSQSLGEGANQSATGNAADNAGNTASATVSGINVDKTAPTITGAPDRAANGAGWYNADVTVSFTCADALSGVAGCTEPKTLGEGANQSATGNAADNAGNTASTTVRGINVDKTAPEVTYSGNAGTYTVDQQVAINCTARDSLSGLASNTCADVKGPAYAFALGDNTYSATAIDKAGNETTNTVSFTVSVTNLSLCSLTRQFISNKGIANSLCVKLENAAKQAAAGQTEASNNILQAYISEVAAQSGKALSAERAEILTRLAMALTR
ncbi:MAG TPA: hypothetical protein VNT01_02725, partial [Symbiobacteriaceae bacterium]|nr:hypothetical protein [Symbiobacteriaceae bacterium]